MICFLFVQVFFLLGFSPFAAALEPLFLPVVARAGGGAGGWRTEVADPAVKFVYEWCM